MREYVVALSELLWPLMMPTINYENIAQHKMQEELRAYRLKGCHQVATMADAKIVECLWNLVSNRQGYHLAQPPQQEQIAGDNQEMVDDERDLTYTDKIARQVDKANASKQKQDLEWAKLQMKLS